MLRLSLLGTGSVRVGDVDVRAPTRKALALVAYLALEGRKDRARVGELLWSSTDVEGARGNLRREIYRLRGTPLAGALVTDATTVSLREPFWCDVLEFLSRLEARDVGAAIGLYHGRLLEGIALADAEGFYEWLDARRASIDERYRTALAIRADALEGGGRFAGGAADLPRSDAPRSDAGDLPPARDAASLRARRA